MSTYRVGNSNTQISLTADIDTFGLAASRAIVLDLQTNDPATTVAISINATGDIFPTVIGTGNSLAGKQLSVMTKIDLVGNEQDRLREADRLNSKYFLNGGPDGPRAFNDAEKVVSDDVTTVILFFAADLIP